MKISWINLPDLIKYELKQRGEEGSDVSALLKEWGDIEQSSAGEKDLGKNAADFFARLNNLPEDIKNIKNEPGIWADIEKLCGIKTDPVPEFSAELVNDRILGGWLGRSAGCLLGKPVEKTPRAGIKELLTSNNTWPLSDYVSGIGIPEELLKKYPWNRHDGRESLKENIRYMNEDDDMNYPMINLDAYERYGEAFTPQNILQNWHMVGGQFAVPTAVGVQGVGAVTTSFKSFGTQLTFTPTVLDKDRIRLQVLPSFSTTDAETTVSGIPGLQMRAVETTVDLREGQWLAIAGLIQDQQEGTKTRVPGVGDIPYLDTLFGRRHVKRDETELLVLVSPELVHPLEAEEAPLILPGMEVTEPSDWDFYVAGDYEGRPNRDYRSTVAPVSQRTSGARWDARRQPAYQGVEARYVQGPHGFSQ